MNFTNLVKLIVAFKFSPRDDYRAWYYSVDGKLTLAKAYANQRVSYPTVRWARWIWDPGVPPCRSTLIWRVINRRIPISSKLYLCGFHGLSVCTLCHCFEENVDQFILLFDLIVLYF